MQKDLILDATEIKRIKTYIKGLDENMQGGVPEGHIVLIHGEAGTMKSSICFNILYNETIFNSKNSLYISLEQSFPSLIKNMVNMGFAIDKLNIINIDDLSNFSAKLKTAKKDGNNFIVVDLGAIRAQIKDVKTSENRSWLNVVKNILLKTKKEVGLDMMTFDSLQALYTLSTFENPRMELFYFFEFIRELDLTAYMISEEAANKSDGIIDSEYFLSDGIINVRLTPFRRNIVREIKIDKMRATKCNNDIFSLEFKGGAFHALYGGQNPLL